MSEYEQSSLLENELVQKYFAIDDWDGGCKRCDAQAVLRAMQEPIRKGDKYLFWKLVPEIMTCATEDLETTWHPDYLRLPDRFQTERKEKCLFCAKESGECKCLENLRAHRCWCGNDNQYHEPAKPSGVEEAIREIRGWVYEHDRECADECIEDKLRNLVDLVRKEGK